MNTPFYFRKSLLSLSLAAVLLAGCSSAPQSPDGAANVRQQLTQLQSDPQLAVLAPLGIKEAELAVVAAERPEKDKALADHRVLLAERKVALAQTQAQTRQLEAQRAGLSQQRDEVRLAARSREAASARADATGARTDAAQARQQAEQAASREDRARLQAASAREDAQSARQQAAASAATTAELRAQIDELNARPTDRGLVVTLGDVLFDTGQASLKGASSSHLAKLAQFLTAHPERTALIEGHTDSVGSAASNVVLSQRRADAVRSFLMAEGIAGNRLNASGKGLDMPVASNNSAEGRQQNRRVEVIISNLE